MSKCHSTTNLIIKIFKTNMKLLVYFFNLLLKYHQFHPSQKQFPPSLLPNIKLKKKKKQIAWQLIAHHRNVLHSLTLFPHYINPPFHSFLRQQHKHKHKIPFKSKNKKLLHSNCRKWQQCPHLQ